MKRFILAALLTLSVLGQLPAQPASAGSQFLWWDGAGSAFAEFGVNEPIIINTGKMQPAECGDDGIDDFITPFTDVYIMPAGSVSDGSTLEDISGGTPNTAEGSGSGLFLDELIGVTGGPIGAGTYAVVYDECQDGRFDAALDALFDPAFEVDVPPGNVPVLPDSLIQLKAQAGVQATEWTIVAAGIHVYNGITALMDAITNWKLLAASVLNRGSVAAQEIFEYLTGKVKEKVVGVEVEEVAWNNARNMAKHYLAISVDPPDPDYQHVTPLGPYPPLDAQSADPLRADFVELGGAAGSEAAIAQALLTSLERYQGAEAVNDAEWALIHARAVHDYALLLASQTAVTAAAADSSAQTLAADPRPIDELLASFESERLRILAGNLTAEERQDFAALGLDDSDLADVQAALADVSYAGTRAGTLSDLADAGTSAVAMAISLLTFAADMNAIITFLENDPGTPDDAPIAQAGGPYTVAEGVSLALDGTQSSSPSGISTYAWDTDGDGAFDDATGATPSVTFASAYGGLVGLEVTDADGRTDVGYALLSVSEVNHTPMISDADPLDLFPRILVGTTQQFSVTTFDPDGDALSLQWQINGAPAGSGNTLAFTPTEADTGFATIQATVSDNHPLGGSVRYIWSVIVVQPDGDGDGWRANADCDDADAGVNPDATEIVGNGKDDDCDPQTTENGAAPLAAFQTSASDGRNVALLEGGATAISVTSPTTTLNTLRNMLNYSNSDAGWGSSTGLVTNQAAIFALAGSQSWLIDRVTIRPSPDNNGVRDFAIDVSTTGTAPGDFTTVLTGTIPTDDNGLQVFTLSTPAQARYIRYRALNNRGGLSIITRQLGIFTSQQAGPTISFSDRSSDPNGDITSWHWDFGDGTTSTEQHPTHTYAAPGSYTVTLTVTDGPGNSTSASVVQKVLTPPGVNFSTSPAIPLEHTAVTFNPSEAGQEGAVPVRWEWDWGDGSTPTVRLTGDNFTHLIEDSGAFTITLRVTDSSGQTGQVQKVVTTTNVAPVVEIGPHQTLVWGQSWSTGQIDVSDRSPIDDLTLVCDWTFGDGQTQQVTACNESAAEIPHAYANPGVYTATVRVTDKDGGTATDSFTITVTKRESFVQFTHAKLLPGNLVELTVKLHDRFSWGAVPGQPVTITLGTTTTTVTTGPDGTATATLSVPAGVDTTAVAYAGNGFYNPSSISRPIRAPKGDIIFVIDESNSMALAISTVKAQLTNIAAGFGNDLDFRIGLVGLGAATGAHGATVNGAPHVHQALTVDVGAVGRQVATLGTSGSHEPAFAGIVYAAGDALEHRPDAGTCIVYIGDDTASTNITADFPETQADALSALQSRQAAFFGFVSTGPLSIADYGPLAAATGGSVSSLGLFQTNPSVVLDALIATCVSQILTPDLVVTVTDERETAQPGETLVYTLTVTNAGFEQADGVVLTDTLPEGASFVAAGDGGSVANGIVTWPAVNLAPGETITRTLTISIDGTLAIGTLLTNSASAGDDGVHGQDPTPQDNTATDTTTLAAPPNSAPRAGDQSVVVEEDGSVPLTLTASDAEGDPLTWTLGSGPAHGTLSGTAPDLVYTPDADYAGPDSFTFQVHDGALDSAVATVTMTVTPVDDAPLATDDAYTTAEDTALTIAAPGVLDNDSDIDSASLSAHVVDQPTHGTLVLGADGSLTYTPEPEYSGSDSFTYRANDGTGLSNIATVSIAVSAVNDPPVADAGDDQSVTERTIVSLDATGSHDRDGDPLTYLWEISAAVPGSPAIEIISATAAQATFAALDDGEYTVRLTVTDPTGEAGVDEVVVTIVNAVPSATIADAPTQVLEGTTINLTGQVTDAGTLDTHTYAWSVTKDGQPYDSGNESTFSFTPDDTGAYVVSLTVTDDDGGQAGDTAGISVANVAPVVTLSIATPALQSGESLTGGGAFDDPGNDSWTATVDYGDGGGTLPLVVNPDKSFTIGHQYLAEGTYTLTVCVSDDDGDAPGCAAAAISVTRATSYAIFAGKDTCSNNGQEIHWSGSSGKALGDVHSNSGLKLSGSSNRVEGTATYRCTVKVTGSNNTFSDGPTQVTDTRPWPVTFTPADFACTITVSGVLDLSKDGAWWVGGTQSSRQLADGTLCADEIKLSGSSISGRVTLVAGKVQISGSNLSLSAYAHGVLAYATSGDLKISGSGASLAGILFAPAGAVDISGSGNVVIHGSVVGWTVKLTGSGWTIDGRLPQE